MPDKKHNMLDDDFAIFDKTTATELQDGQPVDDKKDKPRDEQGRFIAQDDDALKTAKRLAGITDDEQADAEPGEQNKDSEDVDEAEDGVRISRLKNNLLRVEIDNELDPNHKEVFYADSEADLIHKIAVAKKAATKHIEELKRKPEDKSSGQPAKFSAKKLSPDEDFEVLSKWQESPSEALDLLYRKRTGMSLDDFTQKVQLAERKEAVETAARSFLTTNTTFIATPKNGELMQAYIETHGLDDTSVDDLQKAYKFLNSSGLLEQKEITTATDDPTRIERKPEPKKKASSGLFNRSGGNTTAEKTNQNGLSDEELKMLDRMNLEDQKAWFNRRMKALSSR